MQDSDYVTLDATSSYMYNCIFPVADNKHGKQIKQLIF